MRVNVHAHIFNLQTVLTAEAVAIIVARLRNRGFPDFVVEAAEKFLNEQLVKPEFLVEDDLLRRFVRAIGDNPKFKAWVSGTSMPVDLRILGDAPEQLAVDTLKSALGRLSTYLDARDATGSSVLDLFETLLLAMQPEIVDVADKLLAHMGPDDALVALMMDITRPDEGKRDRANFLAQVKGTADAALARPGRIIPFIAVNPIRNNHFDVMRRAIEQYGFVGVKLYPALGFQIESDEIEAVVDYCVEKDVPITMHCTSGGFAKSKVTAQYCEPAHWNRLFARHPDVRICFAHCGGWGGFSHQEPEQGQWSDEIFAYMDSYPNVYADLSYHVDMMHGGDPEAKYLRRLKEIIAHPTYGERILFGTDSWLVRLNLTDDAYWRYFEQKLTPGEFAQIAEVTPREFLGLPGAAHGTSKAVTRHLAFLKANNGRVGDLPASWVRDALPDTTFSPTRADRRWSPNNRAHVLTYKYFRFEAKEIPAQYHDLGFAGSAKLRLHQLGYWRKDHESDEMFDLRCQADAVNLDVFCRTNGASYEGDYDRETAVARLEEVLRQGGRTLAEAAASVDAVFLFKAEVD